MSQAYRLAERAEADVEAIADFIADDNICLFLRPFEVRGEAN